MEDIQIWPGCCNEIDHANSSRPPAIIHETTLGNKALLLDCNKVHLNMEAS